MRSILVLISVLVLFLAGCSDDKVASNENTPQVTAQQIINVYEHFTGDDCPIPLDVCESGTLSGEWIRDDLQGATGTFNGLWITDESDTIGYYNGQFYSIQSKQYNVFSGSISGYYTDQVIGSLYGLWMYDDPRMCPLCGTGHGLFMGIVVYESESRIGYFEGTFGDYELPPEQNNMPMEGIWQKFCHSFDYDITQAK